MDIVVPLQTTVDRAVNQVLGLAIQPLCRTLTCVERPMATFLAPMSFVAHRQAIVEAPRIIALLDVNRLMVSARYQTVQQAPVLVTVVQPMEMLFAPIISVVV